MAKKYRKEFYYGAKWSRTFGWTVSKATDEDLLEFGKPGQFKILMYHPNEELLKEFSIDNKTFENIEDSLVPGMKLLADFISKNHIYVEDLEFLFLEHLKSLGVKKGIN